MNALQQAFGGVTELVTRAMQSKACRGLLFLSQPALQLKFGSTTFAGTRKVFRLLFLNILDPS